MIIRTRFLGMNLNLNLSILRIINFLMIFMKDPDVTLFSRK